MVCNWEHSRIEKEFSVTTFRVEYSKECHRSRMYYFLRIVFSLCCKETLPSFKLCFHLFAYSQIRLLDGDTLVYRAEKRVELELR